MTQAVDADFISPPEEVVLESAQLPIEALPLIRTSSRPPGFMKNPRTMSALICIVIGLAALLAGLAIRDWTWHKTYAIRFQGDIRNGFYWGMQVNKLGMSTTPNSAGDGRPTFWQWYRGWIQIIPKEIDKPSQHAPLRLDYPPLRLAVMSLWVKHLLDANPNLTTWVDDLTTPMLIWNATCEVATAIGMFVFVRLILKRAAQHRRDLIVKSLAPGEQLRPTVPRLMPRETIAALFAALLVWFNPALILEAHGWPQWDVWNMPFFVWAAVACFSEWWFLGGILLTIGSALKGQLLIVAPIFLVWPLLQFRFREAGRLVCGFAVAAVVIVAPWLLDKPIAWAWVIGAMIGLQLEGLSRRPSLKSWLRYSLLVLAIALVAWPWGEGEVQKTCIVIAIALIIAVPIYLLPAKYRGEGKAMEFAPMFALLAITGAVLFEGSLDWLRVGYLHPTDHYRSMNIGSINLCALMETHFGWHIDDPLLAPIAGPNWPTWITQISLQWGLRYLSFFITLLTTIGLAVQDRRKDARVLISVVAPWCIFFMIMPQMHERYMLWGAVLTAAPAILSAEMFILHLLTVTLAFGQILHAMFNSNGDAGHPKWAHFLNTWYPDCSSAVLAIGLVYVLASCTTSRRRPPPRIDTASPTPKILGSGISA